MRKVSEWPEILVGPIVRRVDDGRKVYDTKSKSYSTGTPSVSVFLVLSRPRVARLKIYEGNASPGGRSPLNPSPTAFSTVAVGAKLHVVVLREELAGLTRGKVYGYDIEFSDTVTGPNVNPNTTLGSLLPGNAPSLLDDPTHPLGYTKGCLPSFVLPEEYGKLRVVHASCRKPHGGGPDALSTLDLILEKNANNLAERPQQLFLTGDQIYADDVAPALLNTLAPVGAELLGWTEGYPTVGGGTVNHSHASVAPGARSDFLFDQIKKPKTHYADNHLLFFGDFCAMYVMAWSPALWLIKSGVPQMTPFAYFSKYTGPTTVSQWTSKLPSQVNYTDPTALDAFTSSLVDGTLENWDTTAPLLDYARELPRIRRVLANVSTYMMFDDHEVTDDWYLNGECWIRFRDTEVGRRLLRNALGAYAIFQDWGNRPAEYAATGSRQTLLGLLRHDNANGIRYKPTSCDALLDVGAPTGSGVARLRTAPAVGRVTWNWTIAWEGHVVCSLDTRTYRYFPENKLVNFVGSGLDLAAQLAPDMLTRWISGAGAEAMSQIQEGYTKLNAHLISATEIPKQLAAILTLRLSAPDQVRPIFVISPAPVFGFYVVETLQRLGVIADGASNGPEESGAEVRDNEPWIGSPDALTNLLAGFQSIPAVILSGDVHYAYSTQVTWKAGRGSGTFLQLCSSAAKNSEPLTEVLALTDHITDAWDQGGFPRVASLLWGVVTDTSGVVFQGNPAKQSSFVEDIEDKIFGILGGMQSEGYAETLDIVDGMKDKIVERFSTLRAHPWRLVLGELLVDTPTMVTKIDEIFSGEDVGVGFTTNFLKDDISPAANYGLNRINVARAPKHWYEDFRSAYAVPWLTTFSNALDQRYIGEMNYMSVGHANIGFIRIEPKSGGTFTLAHELLWYTNLRKTGAPMLQGADSIAHCPLLTTRHTTQWPP